MTGMRVKLMLVAVFAVGLLSSGCEQETTAEEHLARAWEHYQNGDYRSGVIELKNVLQTKPDDPDARLLLGETYILLGLGASAEKELREAENLGYRNAEVAYALLQALLLQGRVDDALKRLEEVGDDLTPDMVALVRGDAMLVRGQPREAVGHFESVLAIDPSSVDGLVGLARARASLREYDRAMELVDSARAIDARDARVFLLAGSIALVIDDPVAAEKEFDAATELTKESFDAWIGLARAQLEQGRVADARGSWQRARTLMPESAVARHFGGRLASAEGDEDAATEAFLGVLANVPNYGPAMFELGKIHYRRGNFRQAEKLLQRLVAGAPTSLASRRLLAAVFLKLREPEKAMDILRPPLAWVPQDISLLVLATEAQLQLGDFDEALRYAEQAASADGDSIAALRTLSWAQLAAGRSESAIEELEAARQKGQGDETTDVLLLVAYARQANLDEAMRLAESILEGAPENPFPINFMGTQYEKQGDLERARALFERARGVAPESIRADLNLARLDIKEGDQEAARRRYEAIVKRIPGQPFALTALASLEAQAGRVDEAVAALEAVRRANPTAVPPRILLAHHLLRLGRFEEALAVAGEAAELAPASPDAMGTLGMAQLRSGLVRDALASFKREMELAPASPAGQFHLGLAQVKAEDLAAARDSFELVVSQDPKNVEFRIELAKLEFLEGHLAIALTMLEEVIVMAPGLPEPYELRGDLRMRMGEPARAALSYGQSLERRPDPGVALRYIQSLNAAGQRDEAEAFLERWISEQPDDTQVKTALASIYEQEGNLDDARRMYESIIEARPDVAVAYNNLALLLADEDPSRAAQLAGKAVELAPDHPQMLDTYGWLLVKQGQFQQGLRVLMQASELSPASPDIGYHVAFARWKSGDREGARGDLASILGTEVEFQERDEAEKLFKILTNN